MELEVPFPSEVFDVVVCENSVGMCLNAWHIYHFKVRSTYIHVVENTIIFLPLGEL